MNSNYMLRNVNEKDAALIRKLASECAPLDLHTPYTYWVISTFYGDCCHIMYDGDQPIGFVTAVYSDKQYLVWQIGITFEYRKKNLSNKLIAATLEKAKLKGFSIALVSIDDKNKDSFNAFNGYCNKNHMQFLPSGELTLTDYLDKNFVENETIYTIHL